MIKKIHFLVLIISVFMVSCGHHHSYDGIWRGELQVQDQQTPFLFELKGIQGDSASVILINGEEKVELTGVSLRGDTLFIPIDAYDAYITAIVSNDKMVGRFIKNYIENDSGVPFRADFHTKSRFEVIAKQSANNIEGKWDILFISETGDTAKNVGIFKSVNGIVTGSVLTRSGDLRFLEGAYTNKGVELSAFSGLSPYYLQFTFSGANNFEGYFYTTRNKTRLVATRNNNAGLSDPYNIAKMKQGVSSLEFSLPSLEGKKVSLQDDRYKGKVVIVSILGSWCPNCLDEAEFLAPWYKANKQRGVEIIGLGFERKDDFDYSKEALNRLRLKYGIEYEILFAGKADADGIAKVLPEVENFSGYPTTLFIDKKGNVRKIHTGFTGPATGLFYDDFKKEFNVLIDSLLAE
jgi:thiol-disulfide isomerase/thioredoxin